MGKRTVSAVEHLLDQEAEHAERHRDDPAPADVKGTRPNRGRSVMFSLRLNPDEFADVQRLAEESGVPASALVRGWILHRLAAERDSPASAVAAMERIEDDVRALRRLVVS